jgi:hypothetical protein
LETTERKGVVEQDPMLRHVKNRGGDCRTRLPYQEADHSELTSMLWPFIFILVSRLYRETEPPPGNRKPSQDAALDYCDKQERHTE